MDNRSIQRGLGAILLFAAATIVGAQHQPVPYPTPDDPGSDAFTTTCARLGPDTEGLLLEPVPRRAGPGIGMVFSHPNADNFGERPGWYMVRRGYPVMLVNHRGSTASDDRYLPGISLGIRYLKQRLEIPHVVLLAHSGGGGLGTLYQNVAENDAQACSGREKIYPCEGEGLDDLGPADALILLDPTLGAAHRATAIDPAITDSGRDPSTDMFAEANGFVLNGKANYTPAVVARFYRAQSQRNNRLIDDALGPLRASTAESAAAAGYPETPTKANKEINQ